MSRTTVSWILTGLILGGVVAVLFLSGCSDVEEEPEFSDQLYLPEAEPVAAMSGPEKLLSGVVATHVYKGASSYQIDCNMEGNADVKPVIYIKDLETPKPWVDQGAQSLSCDPMDDWTTAWAVHCSRYFEQTHLLGQPSHWDYFDIVLDKLRWDEKEYIGWITWTADGQFNEDWPFWCVRTFRIVDAELSYIWR